MFYFVFTFKRPQSQILIKQFITIVLFTVHKWSQIAIELPDRYVAKRNHISEPLFLLFYKQYPTADTLLTLGFPPLIVFMVSTLIKIDNKELP